MARCGVDCALFMSHSATYAVQSDRAQWALGRFALSGHQWSTHLPFTSTVPHDISPVTAVTLHSLH